MEEKLHGLQVKVQDLRTCKKQADVNGYIVLVEELSKSIFAMGQEIREIGEKGISYLPIFNGIQREYQTIRERVEWGK